MQGRRKMRRHVVMAMLGVATATTAIVAAGGGTASAAVINQSLDCGVGGSQTMKVSGTAPATVAPGGTFIVDLDPQAATVSGGKIKNMTYSFQAPAGSSIVAGTAQVIGSGTNAGTATASSSGSVVQLSLSGPVADGSSFDAPTVRVQLQATGGAGSVLTMKVRQSGAYTLTALDSINISCNAANPLAAFTSTTIAAPTTTTAPTTTASTTTIAGQTSTTGSTTTTTAPPTTTTQFWSPSGGCGSVQTKAAPQYATSMAISAAGATGGRSGSQASSSTVAGGAGGQAVGTFAVAGGQTISAVVGCAGVNGGGFDNTNTPAGYSVGGGAGRGSIILFQAGASGGSGGASSAVCSGSACKYNTGATPLVVAGGGGGGGVSNCGGTPSGPGGATGTGDIVGVDNGAGPSGAAGSTGGDSGSSSGGGSGGAGGVNGVGAGADGATSASPGTLDGAGVSVAGGGGGGGFSGGAAGAKSDTGCKGAGGGGGGSSWVSMNGTNASFGTASGTAAVTVTFTIVTPAPTTTTTSTTTTAPTTTTTAVPTCQPDFVPFASVAALVDQQIADFGASSSIRNTWITSISDCTKTAEDLIFSLLPTDQTSNDAKMFRVYHSYFLRPPDLSGFNHYLSDLANGRPIANIALEFSLSDEFKARYGTVENGQFVDLLYFNILNRFAEPAGRAFWVKQLDTHTQDRGQVLLEFSEGVENVNFKVRYVAVFRMFLTMRQTPPTKTEFEALVNPLLFFNAPDARSAANPIRHSAGYAVRFG